MITVKAKKGEKRAWQEEVERGGEQGVKGREEGGEGEGEEGKDGEEVMKAFPLGGWLRPVMI